MENATRDEEEKLQNERINTVKFIICVFGSTGRSFRNIEMAKKIEEEEERNAPVDVADDSNYEKSDLFCEEADDEGYNLCSGCDEKPIAHLVQPCRHVICTDCVKKTNCQLCG